MFDDIKKEDENIVAGDPSKVEDVFGEVDPTPDLKSAVQEGKIKPVEQAGAAPVAPQQGATMPPAGTPPSQGPQGQVGPPKPLTNLSQLEEWSGKKKSKKGFIISIVVLIITLAAVSAGAYWYFSGSQVPPVIDDGEGVDVMENTNQDERAPVENTNLNDSKDEPNTLIDADLDGLTDLEEQSLGTDPDDPDTDNDGLNDRDEYRVHKTNPLSTDTDNDGLNDREELFVWLTDPSNPDTDGDGYLDGAEVENGYSPNGPERLEPDELSL